MQILKKIVFLVLAAVIIFGNIQNVFAQEKPKLISAKEVKELVEKNQRTNFSDQKFSGRPGMFPKIAIRITGNSYDGIKVIARNTEPLPAGGVIVAGSREANGEVEYFAGYEYSNEVPAMNLWYELEKHRAYAAANFAGVGVYRIFLIQPSRIETYSHEFNWSRNFGPKVKKNIFYNPVLSWTNSVLNANMMLNQDTASSFALMLYDAEINFDAKLDLENVNFSDSGKEIFASINESGDFPLKYLDSFYFSGCNGFGVCDTIKLVVPPKPAQIGR